ncbi:unnamed protein product [Rotaria sordida]|uniref:Tr-type G domain-containing protein n=2 Tax=Rotaria sordida TaxID=392033 RepID=A0A818WDB2_9BILA|nr:unnamed protein product [Rotaria sordida]CAF3722747.1 unnamed protein product [Rotaria sordida]
MLCVDAPTGVVDTTREHLSLAIALGLPVFVVINKIDMCSQATIQQTLECVTSLLKRGDDSVQFKPYFIQNEADLIKAADMFVKKHICPILSISCITGENIDLLKKFLNILPPRLSRNDQEILSQLPVEYRIDQIYTNNISDEVVVGGTLRSGTINEGDSYLVGPLLDGSFIPAKVATIQRYHVPRRIVHAGQSASLSLLGIKSSQLRKGMVLVSPALNPQACYEFVAEISITMHHTNTPIHKGFETTVQIENIRQTAVILDIDMDELHANKKAIVKFRFKTRCEYVLEGSRLIFRSGQQTKGSGRVIKALPQNQ